MILLSVSSLGGMLVVVLGPPALAAYFYWHGRWEPATWSTIGCFFSVLFAFGALDDLRR